MTDAQGRSPRAGEAGREGDENSRYADQGRNDDNSLGRLLALSDGVFAIAMTLLALDLVVPALGDSPTDGALRHALAQNIPAYISFLISFYLIAGYWSRHREVMKNVVKTHPRLYRDTLLLLFLVAAMPFPSSLLGRYGGDGFSLALYGAFNLSASLTVVQIKHDVRKLRLAADPGEVVFTPQERRETWGNSIVFALVIPAGYLFGSYGAFALLLLIVVGRGPTLWRRIITARRRRKERAETMPLTL